MLIRKILMPTDFSPCAQAAFHHAVFMAHVLRAELHLLHVVALHTLDNEESGTAHGDSFPDMLAIYDRLASVARGRMHRTASGAQVASLNVREVERRAVSPAAAILEYADEEAIDLIVIGTHGRRGLRRWMLGSVAGEVVRLGGCPVLTVHGDETTARWDQVDRLLVPFDFSDDARTALAGAKELAAAFGSRRLDLIHVTTPPVAPGGAGVPMPGPAYFHDLRQHQEDALAAVVAGAAQTDLAVEGHVLTGHPPTAIADYADEAAVDLIVIGSHGLTGVRRLLMGSVSERVVRLSNRPVLVLRHGQLSSDVAEEQDA